MVLPFGALVLCLAVPFYFFLDPDDHFYRKLEVSIFLVAAGLAFGAIRLLQLVWKSRRKDT